ncbi:MAG: proline--tRNA ligase [Lactobacillales bacterium]|jgi:prolyl-tRNA synthetase|nr:proline--tRNA ligase [Lactobacillales bacterium]
MALQNTRQSNYPEWYQNVITAADMAELSPSPGCMVIKPWGYGIWERIQRLLDDKIKETGHENCYFPIFIPLNYFQKEAQHVEGFAKEMAIVTHSKLTMQDGKLTPDGKLDEPLVVRPTSETIIADAFSKWVRSYRDLPVLINQWANVVRWEMRPRLFLRTREFLWQEGHTAHATYEEAEIETQKMLDVYVSLAEDDLAIPVLKGKKPEHEKFPGAVDTYTFEPMMQDGRALQAGTSHFLGQNFAKSADIKFQNDQGGLEYAFTTSWGVSTRLIGGVIMSHADDEGMCVPPKIAPYQIVIVPIIKNEEHRDIVMPYISKLMDSLKEKSCWGEKIRVKLDDRNKESTDKYWEWTRKGAPIILEIGPKDVEKGSVMVRNRIKINTPEWKSFVPVAEFAASVSDRLAAIQNEMYAKAADRLTKNITTIETPAEMAQYFSNPNIWVETPDKPTVAFVKGKWSGDAATIEKMKELKITIRCIPFEQSGSEGVCLISGEKATMDVIYARSY